jgi:hypothetical protein
MLPAVVMPAQATPTPTPSREVALSADASAVLASTATLLLGHALLAQPASSRALVFPMILAWHAA